MAPLRFFRCVSCWWSAGTSIFFRNKFHNNSKVGCGACVGAFELNFERGDGISARETKYFTLGLARLAGPLLLIASVLGLAGCHRGEARDVDAKILFTQVPQATSGDRNQQDVIEGTVSGARIGERLVVYSKTGGLWWLQPLLTSPFTAILPGGVWRNETHLGSDYAVLLVEPAYQPLAVLDKLPQPGRGVASVAVAPGQEKSSSHFIDFSGFTWRVRWKPSDRGGTLSPYVPENVSTDDAGALHMRIVSRDGKWTCAELNLTRSLGYGTYSFVIEDMSKLDTSAVFGIFTWDYSTDQENHREFDIDISRWGDPQRKNAEFVVQPAFLPVNSSRFEAPAGKLKYTIVWEPGRIVMTTSRMNGSLDGAIVSRHVFTTEIPTPGSESLRMTLYVYADPNHKASGLQHPVEVIVDGFEFLP
jgi:hypothetical protein